MIVTVFRSRLRPENQQAYAEMADELSATAAMMPGHVAHKGFVAEDGERVTIVEFESEETQRAWAENQIHRVAQRLGRDQFYSDYSIQVCQVLRSATFNHAER